MNFETLRTKYINYISTIQFNNFINKVEVCSPLRVNFSAGWNDTPPYCNENIGCTLNAPILYENEFPIKVVIKKIKAHKIILKSYDLHSQTEITDIYQLLDCQSPSKPFALHKCAILASGLIPFNEKFNLSVFLKKYGGFELSTSVKNIPLGSGLGTSSILIFSCIKAILKFCGVNFTNNELFNKTVCAEQILSTGGGYQDQIGGCDNGFKMIYFEPGFITNIKYEKIIIDDFIKQQINNRLIFIYAGQTRLAKNILVEIMNNYMQNDIETIHTLKNISYIAQNMKNNLISGNINSFAQNMIKSFDLTTKLNQNFSNATIHSILEFIKPFSDGYMLSGAGNGGFLTIILKENCAKKDFNIIFNKHFSNTNIKIFNFKLFF